MRFGFYYKTSDGSRHESEIDSPSRDEAFSTLRERGIRPIKLFAKGCYETSKGTRGYGRGVVVAWGVFAAIVAACFTAFFFLHFDLDETVETDSGVHVGHHGVFARTRAGKARRIAKPRPRKQIADRGRVREIASSFSYLSDRFLALFVEPGVVPSSEELSGFSSAAIENDLYDSFDDVIFIEPTDAQDVVDLKRVIVWLRDEAETFLSNNDRSVEGLMKWLVERQRMECVYRLQIIQDAKLNGLDAVAINAKLSELSLKPITVK